MKLKFWLLFLFFCHLPQLKAADEVLDSLQQQLWISTDTSRVRIINRISWELGNQNPELSVIYGEKAIELSEQLNYKKGLTDAYTNLGRTYRIIGKYEKAIENVELSLELEKERGDLKGIATAHNELGNIYRHLGDFPNSLSNFLESIRILEDIDREENIGSVKMNAAYLYQNQGEDERALGMCLDAIRIFRKYENLNSEGKACTCLGIAYANLEDIDSSIYYFNRSLDIFRETKQTVIVPKALMNLGIMHLELGEIDKALELTKESTYLSDSLGLLNDLSIAYFTLGEIFLSSNQLDSARHYLQLSLEIANETGSMLVLSENLKYTADTYHLAGEDDKAYEFRLLYEQVMDSMYSAQKSEQLIKIQEQLNAEKKAYEITQLNLEKQAAEATSANRTTLLIASIILLVVLILGVLLYLRQRKTKEEQKRTALEQKVLRAQMNPHFIFNSLNSIQRMYIEGELDLANDYMGDFGSLLRSILDNSSKSFISLKEELKTLNLYLDMEKIRTDGLINYNISTDDRIDLLNTMVPPLIIQPFAENAIWHGILPTGNKGDITISLQLKNSDLIECTIEDDGVGISNSKKEKKNKHISKGMKITQERLGGAHSVKAEDRTGGGTIITLLIPLTT